MTGEDKEELWIEAMRAKGHTPILEDGRLDIFVKDTGIHNGPGCSVCGWSTCWHCNNANAINAIPKCAGHK